MAYEAHIEVSHGMAMHRKLWFPVAVVPGGEIWHRTGARAMQPGCDESYPYSVKLGGVSRCAASLEAAEAQAHDMAATFG